MELTPTLRLSGSGHEDDIIIWGLGTLLSGVQMINFRNLGERSPVFQSWKVHG